MINKKTKTEQSLIVFYSIHCAKVFTKAFIYTLKPLLRFLIYMAVSALLFLAGCIFLNGLVKSVNDINEFMSKNPDYVCEHIPSICDSLK